MPASIPPLPSRSIPPGRPRDPQLIPLDTPHVKVVEVSPNTVFPEPPKPASWLAPPATAAPPSSPPTWAASILSPFAGLAVGTVAVGVAFELRRRARRRSFAQQLARFSTAAERALGDDKTPTAGERRSGYNGRGTLRSLGSDSGGSLRARAREAERQLAVLEELIAEGLELGRRFSGGGALARRVGEDRRRFQSCARGLSRRRVRVERATKELRVMEEVEQLLERLDTSTGGAAAVGVLGLGDTPMGEGGQGGLEDSDSDSDDSSGSDSDARDENGGIKRRRRRGVAQHNPRPAARLATRASLLLSNRSSGNSDSDSESGAAAAAASSTQASSRCVFREELRQWCARLAIREQEAVDRLKLGLQNWDLDVVDRALVQLRLLELPEIVKEFKKKREDVRGKRWRLREDLKVKES